jgi:TM2 domain-containing membrane protein YozV
MSEQPSDYTGWPYVEAGAEPWGDDPVGPSGDPQQPYVAQQPNEELRQPNPYLWQAPPEPSQQPYGVPGQPFGAQGFADPSAPQQPYGALAQLSVSLGTYPGQTVETPVGTLVVGNKSKLAAGLLGVFLGGLGVGSFYRGFIGRGVAQLFVSMITLGFGATWGLIEGILVLCSKPGDTFSFDSDGYLLSQ